MNQIDGDVFVLLKKQGGVLIHQVNCQKVAGAGIALKVRETFPQWYASYVKSTAVLGQATLIMVRVAPPTYIASLYAQQSYGRTGQHTDYNAFKQALGYLMPMLPVDTPVFVPYGIGCGLGGGNWTVISQLLSKYLPHAIIVRYVP